MQTLESALGVVAMANRFGPISPVTLTDPQGNPVDLKANP